MQKGSKSRVQDDLSKLDIELKENEKKFSSYQEGNQVLKKKLHEITIAHERELKKQKKLEVQRIEMHQITQVLKFDLEDLVINFFNKGKRN